MQIALAQIAVDAGFDKLGADGTYDGAPVKILFAEDDEAGFDGFGQQARPVGRRIHLKVRVSDVALPAIGGLFVVNGETHKVVAEPTRADTARLVWLCKVGPV
jgi:hypothetical protein